MIKPLNRRGTWRTYSLDDSLVELRIEHIAEDSAGYIWFATWDDGAIRFDGDEFQTFTQQDGLCGDRVFAIYLDSQESPVVRYNKRGLLVRRDRVPPFAR